ncbi:MAG: hypothetical protein WBG39_00795 [Gordonia sp. (in: high G+C Gram-positive bacteria)]
MRLPQLARLRMAIGTETGSIPKGTDMDNYASVERTEWIRGLSVHLADRAEAAPWMTAVRLGDESVTFGDLVDSLNGYRRVVDPQYMSVESALTAAVMHNLPSLSKLPPVELARSMQQIVDWLGRDLPSIETGVRSVV